MPLTFTGRKRIRKDFSQIGSAVPMPNLIEVQKKLLGMLFYNLV